MSVPSSDALVFFGATGDLTYKQIFPSLQGLIRKEGFNPPIIGVSLDGSPEVLNRYPSADIHLDSIGDLLDCNRAAFMKG